MVTFELLCTQKNSLWSFKKDWIEHFQRSILLIRPKLLSITNESTLLIGQCYILLSWIYVWMWKRPRNEVLNFPRLKRKMFVCPFVCLFGNPFVCLTDRSLFFNPFVCSLFIWLSVCFSVCQFFKSFVHLSLCSYRPTLYDFLCQLVKGEMWRSIFVIVPI